MTPDRTVALAALRLARELIAELVVLCREPLHVEQLAQLEDLEREISESGSGVPPLSCVDCVPSLDPLSREV